MAVKFVRTCDRCGKVIREGNANSTLTVGEGNSLNFYTKDEHKSYDICDECAEAFENFMNSAALKPIGIDFYSKEYKMRRTIEDVHEHFGVARPENKHNPHAWSDEVLSLCPEAKEGYDADAVKKHWKNTTLMVGLAITVITNTNGPKKRTCFSLRRGVVK